MEHVLFFDASLIVWKFDAVRMRKQRSAYIPSPTYAAEKMLSRTSVLALVLITAAVLYHWFEPQAKEWMEGNTVMEKKKTGKKIAIG